MNRRTFIAGLAAGMGLHLEMPRNMGKTKILVDHALQADQAAFLTSRHFTTQEIARLFRIPEGALEGATRSPRLQMRQYSGGIEIKTCKDEVS
jgi:hypothetical protein